MVAWKIIGKEAAPSCLFHRTLLKEDLGDYLKIYQDTDYQCFFPGNEMVRI